MRKIWSEYAWLYGNIARTVYEYLVSFNLLQCFATYRTSLCTVKTGPSSALMWLTILFPVKLLQHCRFPKNSPWSTGSPSSKYEHRRASALLRNIQNIMICIGKKTYRFCNLRKWKDFNKKQLTLLKMCVTSLLCGTRTDLWTFYGFLCKRFSLYIKLNLF